jgi:lipooligosaccharide transport system ATP-binding protein
MDEAQHLCDRLVVMDKAHIVAEGSQRSLIDQHSSREVLEVRLSDSVRASMDGKLEGIGQRVEVLPDRVLIYTDDGERAIEEISARHIPVEGTLVRRSSLEDVFLRLTGRSLIE